MHEEELSQRLCEENEEFRRIKEEHAWLHRRVEKLDGKSFLTPAEQRTRAELKKRKLLLKDKMEALLVEYRDRIEGVQ